MRDVLIHEYFGVDLETVWKTVKEDIHQIKPDMADILNKVRQDIPDLIRTDLP
jgi:uncharacterized protein with HEPN domain